MTAPARTVTIAPGIVIGPGRPLALMAGPCVIESDDLMMRVAEKMVAMTAKLKLPYIFKSSFEKDNRSNEVFYRGPGLEKGLALLARVKKEFGVPVVSDIHRETDLKAAAEVLDILQIPAFLCQQTSLLLAAGKTGKPVNVKKGQFMSPDNMKGAVSKILSTGNDRILLCERGTLFGYNNLVNDFTAIPVMQDTGCPVVYDATHSVRRYGIPSSDPAGGKPQYVPYLVRCGVAAGCDALFMETHPDPPKALCDASSQYPLDRMETLLEQACRISEIAR
ncbi:MAG: 3-deoxy-8-phosphooctulonate synthase [Acidobacteria bacterium]|nr:3-deoxy-8-phosphooctulonate synthase [Acidobacteriota bacterium]